METQFTTNIKKTIKNWWAPIVIGILLTLTAIWTFTSPQESYLALSIIFSLSFLTAGIVDIIFSISNRENIKNWGWNLAFGIITAIMGVLMLINPAISMVTLPLYVGFVILFRSIMAIGWATDLKAQGFLDWGNLMVMGILGTIFAFILLWNPILGGMTIVFWTGVAFLFAGIFNIYLGFRLRKVHKNISE